LRIGIVSRWNATCGVAVHAEMIAKELQSMGHEVRVYAPTIESASRDWHHKLVKPVDEENVERCYVEATDTGFYCSLHDIDALIIEGYARLPAHALGEQVAAARRRGSPTIMILHEGEPAPAARLLKNIPVDHVAVFDDRWISEILYPLRDSFEADVHIIPYPCMKPLTDKPYRPGFAEGKRLIVSFGRQPVEEYVDYIKALTMIEGREDFIYWVIRSDGPLPFEKPWLRVTYARLETRDVHSILLGADLHLLPKGWTRKVVLSSTIYMTIATLTPIIAPYTRYTEDIPVDEQGYGPVVKYMRVRELARKITLLLDDEELRGRVRRMASRFAEERSADKIARRIADILS